MRLRAELCRGLVSLAATGHFPGIDIKSIMLRDGRGKTFEDLLCHFSIMVVFRLHEIMTERENQRGAAPIPSRFEERSLMPLTTVYNTSLTTLLKKKQSQRSLRDLYNQLKYALALEETHLRDSCRVNKIKDKIDVRGAEQHVREVTEAADQFNIDWENDPKWKDVIQGNKIEVPDEILKHVFPEGRIPVLNYASDEAPASDQLSWSWKLDEIAKAQEVEPQSNLSEDLDERLKAQIASIEHWKSFANQFRSDERGSSTSSGSSPRRGSVIERVEEYEKRMEMANTDVPGGSRPRKSCTGRNGKGQGSDDNATTSSNGSEKDLKAANFRPPDEKSTVVKEKTDVISPETARPIISAPSSPPKRQTPLKLPKPLKYQASLVDRTRVSMALAKAEDKAGNSSTRTDDVSSLPIHVAVSPPSGSDLKSPGSETLVGRTRKSTSLLPVKSRAPRTPLSNKLSTAYLVNNPFETPKGSHADMPGISTPPEEVFGGNAKHASVFKGRPKTALSPTRAPSLGCMDVVNESKNDVFASQKMAGSPPQDANRSTRRS